jgi:molecular chaperone GrpE
MIDEEKQPEDIQVSTGGTSDAINADERREASAEGLPELERVEPSEVTAPGSEVMTDDTDYEAAFMELRSTFAAKEREMESLKVQLEDRSNQYMRIVADFENFRRRTQKEKEDLETQIKCSTINELLPVVYNFERARSHIKPQTDGELNIHKSYQGVYKDLVDRLKKIGVSPMRSEGKEFDPTLHEAVMREPTNQHAEGIVMEELVRGYMLGERVLRHAMVKVAAASEEETVHQDEEAAAS